MKWVIIKSSSGDVLSPEFMKPQQISRALPMNAPIDQSSFVTLQGAKALNLQSMMWSKWVSYRFKPKSMTRKGKSGYELYCGGWLAFYDRIMKKFKGSTGHVIYFKWEATRVTIYISPPHRNTLTKKQVKTTWTTQQFVSSQISPAKDPPTPPPPPPPPMG